MTAFPPDDLPTTPPVEEKPWDGELQITWTRGGVRRITIEIDGLGATTVDCAAQDDAGTQIEQYDPADRVESVLSTDVSEGGR